MTDFEKRLEKAIQRGQRVGRARAQAELEKALTEQELRRLHGQYRLELVEHLEDVLRMLARRLPGFRFESVVSERGWGGAVSHDEVARRPGGTIDHVFNRLEMVVRPVSDLFVLELIAKGTVRNREVFTRSHYQKIGDVDLTSFRNMIDAWVLEYAELYAAGS